MTCPTRRPAGRSGRVRLQPVLALAACGTTCDPSGITAEDRAFAAAERQAAPPTDRPRAMDFAAVASRVESVAEACCRRHIRRSADCDTVVRVDPDPFAPPNAFQSYRAGKAVVTFTPAMIAGARDDDEIAFVLGHEMGQRWATPWPSTSPSSSRPSPAR